VDIELVKNIVKGSVSLTNVILQLNMRYSGHSRKILKKIILDNDIDTSHFKNNQSNLLLKNFIIKSNKIHNNKYDYSKVEYVNTSKKIIIICPLHGEFIQSPRNHISGNGCTKCHYSERYNNSKRKNKEDLKKNYSIKDLIENSENFNKYKISQELIKLPLKEREKYFITLSKIVHNNKYEYDKFKYINSKIPVTIKCPIHGYFTQRIEEHINKKMGCQKCGKISSKMEEKICSFIKNKLKLEIIERSRKIILPKELDIFIPSKNIAIELHGNRWHSEVVSIKYHKDIKEVKNHLKIKYDICKLKNIQLLQFYEDEIYFKLKIIKRMIRHKLGKSKKTFYARKLILKEINKNECKQFLDKFHIQGKCKFKKSYGLFTSKNKLISVMAFSYHVSHRGKKFNNTEWELVRFASKYSVVGGASRLLKEFIRNTPKCKKIISYSDNRFSLGELYRILGFKKDKDIKKDYYYVNHKDKYLIRYHKSYMKKSNQESLSKSSNFKFDDNLTEYQNSHNNGFYRIWDAGKIKWVLDL